MAQGLSLSYAQAGAMATNPKLAGTAAGVGVFMQNFCGAAFAQLYGFLADGTRGAVDRDDGDHRAMRRYVAGVAAVRDGAAAAPRLDIRSK